MNPDISDSPTTPESQTARDDYVEMLLDLALEATFPASDAVALPLSTDLAATNRSCSGGFRSAASYPPRDGDTV